MSNIAKSDLSEIDLNATYDFADEIEKLNKTKTTINRSDELLFDCLFNSLTWLFVWLRFLIGKQRKILRNRPTTTIKATVIRRNKKPTDQ